MAAAAFAACWDPFPLIFRRAVPHPAPHAPGGAPYEPGKQGLLVRVTGGCMFRVPLDGEDVRIVGHVHGFDDTILGDGVDA